MTDEQFFANIKAGIEKLIRDAVLRERDACAGLVRKMLVRSIGENVAKAIEARP